MSHIRDFVVLTTEHYYNVNNLKVNEKADEAFSEFVQNSQILLLQSVIYKNELVLHTKIQFDTKKSIVFYKTGALELNSEDSIKDINLITLSSNAAESLYQILKQIYSPLLTTGNDLFSNKVQKNLYDLEANLRIITHGNSKENLNDEVEYWKSLREKKDVSKKEREAASAFYDLFEDIANEIRTMQGSSLSDIREATENVGGILDDVWRLTTSPYSQERMIHIFNIIGHVISSIIQKIILPSEVWQIYKGPKENDILISLSDSLSVIQTWTSACKSLTETYWPYYALHAWNGNTYVPSFCINFEKRLNEIYEIRSTFCQLNKLLTSSEKEDLKIQNLFQPFESINLWLYNGSNPAWDAAMARFQSSLRPAETIIAEKIKPRLHNTSIKQMLYEFMRYKALIDRPWVKSALNSELEIFVSSLLSMLRSIKTQLETDDIDVQMYQPPEMSPVVQQVQWAKQMELKVKDIRTCVEKCLRDFDGSNELLTLADQLLKDLKAFYMQLHEDWSRELQAQVKSGSLQLCTNKPVVEFSGASRMMVVQYDARVIRAESEARALKALGLPPPAAAAALTTLSAALAQAQRLHQVASFHNTLGERMIPSTRPMMLQAALDLSSLVQDQKAVYWNDTEQLANYTDKLMTSVLKLEKQNSYLTKQHVAIRGIVEILLDTELMAHQNEWKKKIKEIRDIIEKVEHNGYKNTESWRLHWDWQLYKALEYQYIKTLLSLHKHFPHVKVDLVLRGYEVRVQPALEEVRAQHYHQLRRLVSLPAHFVGVHGDVTARTVNFADIVHKHSWLGNKAVEQLEEALSGVEKTCVSWTRRAALACVDLDALCAEHVTQPVHWENNFKACKAYGQAVAKMTFEDEKIEWISIVSTGLRRELEAQARALWSRLTATLRKSCRDDSRVLQDFGEAVRAVLPGASTGRASDVAELAAKHQKLLSDMPEMEICIENLRQKGHMLRTWGGDSTVDDAIKEWKTTREMMLSHQQMFEHQAEAMKSSLSSDWENLNTTLEAWTTRWSHDKTQLEDTRGVKLAELAARGRFILEARDRWDKFLSERDRLVAESAKFNLVLQHSEVWTEAEKLMSEYTSVWTILKDYYEEYYSITEQEWIVFQRKLHLLDEFVSKWMGKLEPYTVVTLYIQQDLEKYADLTTLLKYLRGTDFTERHWREVFGLLELEYKKPDTLQVKDFLEVAANIKKQIKFLQKICTSASSEAAIRNALNELELWFAGARLTITYYNDKSKRATPIVKDFKDILTKIEEQQWVVSSVAGGDGGSECGTWEARLRAASVALRAAGHAQRRWLYLEPILSNDDGELGTKFRRVDQGFRQVTRMLEADPRLSAVVQSSRLQPLLDSISEQLHVCQSSLNQYIDEKRSIFPRLYFLSDDDLLELLGQARSGAEGRAAVMQTHLKKLFPGISGVKLGPQDMSITALYSQYDEGLQLDHPIDIDCSVEIWLKNLENEVRSSLRSLTLKCVTSSMQEQDPFTLPTQILCLAQNIRFTEQVEKAIAVKELHKLKENIEKENANYSTNDIDDESERLKRQAVILQCGHYLFVIQTLIDNNVVLTSDWHWQKQLRFYVSNNKEVIAKMGLATISYSYEYLGVNTGQFVRTELADECFLILTQSLHLGFVGNPFGPAGTGKTESVKALGGLLGRLVLIFNCDEAMDCECMGRLLSGLALCGAWGCFDEFNRLSAETLAGVTHQLASLLPAIQPAAPGEERVALLNGKHIKVSEWCGVAATMNPTGRGYGGRRELPAALERLLRPVSMTQAAAQLLAARLLAARCVAHANALAADLHAVFSAASQLLSEQRHYDWGLRALKAAVGSCGAALSAHTNAALQVQRQITRRVLRLNNLSKLTNDDALRFENILSLVFSGVPEEEHSVDPINDALNSAFESLGLVKNKSQIQKCMELYEQMQQRMGVALVGPPGSGKTVIRQLLKTALQNQGKNVVEYVISPKAMTRSSLLGRIDHDTRQWTDGVISSTALEISNQPLDVLCWVVCDGDVDPEWVESLNSVLDDNRVLSLAAGWRVQFANNVNFVFETDALKHASPATVSRLGIILLSEESSCVQQVLDCWIQKTDQENETINLALPILQKAIKKCLKWFSTNTSRVLMKTYDVSMVKLILTQFDYIIQNIGSGTMRSSPEELVYMAIDLSVSGLLKEGSIASFQEEMSDLLGLPPSPELVARTGDWVSDGLLLSERIAACEPFLRACLNSESCHLGLAGQGGAGKSLLIEYVLKETNFTVITVDITPIMEPDDVIAELKRNNVIFAGGGGGGGGSAALVVRGLHRAATDSWGCSAIQQLLLQLVQHGGVWWSGGGGGGGEGARAEWWGARRVRVVVTSSAPLAPRLAAALAFRVLREPDDEELLEVSTFYLKQSVGKSFAHKDISNIASSMLAMYKELTETFDSQPHYKWNADHLNNWCEYVKLYSPTNTAELNVATQAEALAIFKNRLISEEEKQKYDVICNKHLKVKTVDNTCFVPKIKGDGIYMEPIDYKEWCQRAQKLINQCLTENEHIFGDLGVDVSQELETLCSTMTRACATRSVGVFAGGAGAGACAAAAVTAAALSATLFHLRHHQQFLPVLKNAVTSASDGTRTLLVVHELAVTTTVLSTIEAIHSASSLYAIPLSVMPSQNSPHMLTNIKKYLGIVILLDKDQENTWEVIEKYPLLHNASYFMWLERWSDQTLRQLPTLVIQRLCKENLTDTSKEELQVVPTEGFVQIHDSIKTNWLRAPCRYVNFIKTYFNIVNTKKQSLTQRKNMLTAGVEALRRARSEVATLQTEAATQEAALLEKQESVNQALEQIAATVRADTDRQEEMHALRDNIKAENEKLQIRKKEIEAELASVEPIIAAARAAVGDIRPESLSEIRSLRAPPEVVRDVLEGVLRLMGIADTSWHSMKNFLSKRGVKEDIRCLDAGQISAEAAESVERLLRTRGASFEQATAKRASAACAPLAAWVRANLAHHAALARVRPLQAQQNELTRNLRSAEEQLNALSSGLASVEQRVAELRQRLGQQARDAAALELSVAAAERTIGAAAGLVAALAAESDNWLTDLETISKEVLDLNHRSLLAAAYIVYLPDVTEPEAKEHLEKWSALIGFEDTSFSVINFLAGTEKQLKWHADGLPSDTSAIKNAVFIDQTLQLQRCGFTPLIIDPDGEALSWLKACLDGHCDLVSQHADKLLTTVQYAVRFHRTLLITEVDEVHPSWASLLGGPTHLLLVTRSMPTMPPTIAARLSPLYFTGRRDALAEQLVHYALQQLKPEVNEKSNDIKLKKASLQKQQHELQENLLSVLSTNNDILHDTNLLASLNKTRETSATISEALKVALAIESDISSASEAYRPTAERTAMLTIAVKKLAAHWPLVTLPIDVVLDVFVDALKRENSDSINTSQAIKYITRRITERVLLSLHRKDKYKVVLHILKQVFDELIPEKLWQFFLGNYINNEDQNAVKEIKKICSWIPDESIKAVAQLKVTDENLFNKLALQNADLWGKFLSTGDLNIISHLPLRHFEVIVAVSTLRPDSTYRAIVALVDDILGAGVVGGSGASRLSAAEKWAGRRRAALLLGAHAHDALLPLARQLQRTLTIVGVEEGLAAWEKAVMAARGGAWVALLVGASPIAPPLQAFLQAHAHRQLDDFSEEFQLWVLSEDRDIPAVVANSCVNVILEAPEGVKHNALSTLLALGGPASEAANEKRARASLALFHAIVQERRAYIPQGWTRWYSWEWGEVAASAAALCGGAGARPLGLALYAARAARADTRPLAALHRAAPALLPALTAHAPQDYVSAFETLPNIDTADLLGLPANCRIAWERNAANDIISGLKELDTTTVNAKQESKNHMTPLKMILTLWKKLMSGNEFVKGDYKVDKSAESGWWGGVRACESAAAARVVRRVHRALGTLARTTRANTATTATTLLNTPEEWQCWWAGPASGAQYVRALAHRARAVRALSAHMPAEVDLRAFMYPLRVIWALRMRTAELLGCSVDSLTLVTKWDARSEECKEDGLVVVGLQISGACWRDGALRAAGSDAAPRQDAPPLLLRHRPVNSSPLEPEGTIEVPLYSSEARDSELLVTRAPLSRDYRVETATMHHIALFIAELD